MQNVNPKAFEPVAQVRPHLYLCVYPSGLKFWRVARIPLRWVRLTDEEKLFLHAALVRAEYLNRKGVCQ